MFEARLQFRMPAVPMMEPLHATVDTAAGTIHTNALELMIILSMIRVYASSICKCQCSIIARSLRKIHLFVIGVSLNTNMFKSTFVFVLVSFAVIARIYRSSSWPLKIYYMNSF